MILGSVAIVGRPNVGKSTLFNRLTGTDQAIVDDRPGVTRDRLFGMVFTDVEKSAGFMVVDTGGFEKDDFKFQPFQENMVWKQTDAAIQAADLVLLVFDAKSGLHPHDKELFLYLERLKKPYLIAVNKIDVFGYRFGKGMTSLSITVMQKFGTVFSDAVYGSIGLCAAMGWLILLRPLRRHLENTPED
ncbi:hypothetical protein E3A20_05530 [Planctomyces bekefii]|uniref:G domain-containing protein n=1 Tax=Planctomyces bekefii TaxID=1653850 RepID=A0A5C6M8D9_9PLAN|nr:hypothetical protein E3A20_05530 [Planctomyces bekefii]